jgi:transposase
VEALSLLEAQSEQGHIDLYYGDESKVCQEGYVPYGWQFKGEKVSMPVAKGSGINIFGLISRNNLFHYATSRASIKAEFILAELDKLSLQISKPTVVVLDNAKVHVARKVKQQFKYWQQRGLFIFYLPPYSPHLNICERVWKELKARWLKPQDYLTADNLFYAVFMVLAAIGKHLRIAFGDAKVY